MNETKTTVLHIAIDGEYRGSIEVEDTIKEDSVEAIQRIKELGVAHTVMLTGDREEVAAHIAREAGLDEYHGWPTARRQDRFLAQLSRRSTQR